MSTTSSNPACRAGDLCQRRVPTLHAGLEIYVDDEFRPAGAPPAEWAAATDARGGGGGDGSPGWAHLGTFEQTRKENVQQPAPWFGARPRRYRGGAPLGAWAAP